MSWLFFHFLLYLCRKSAIVWNQKQVYQQTEFLVNAYYITQ